MVNNTIHNIHNILYKGFLRIWYLLLKNKINSFKKGNKPLEILACLEGEKSKDLI